MNGQQIPPDDLFKRIGILDVLLQIANGRIAQLEQQLVAAKKDDTGKQPKNDNDK